MLAILVWLWIVCVCNISRILRKALVGTWPMLVLVLVLFWLSPTSGKGDLLKEIAASPTLDNKFNSLPSSKKMLGFSKNQDVLFRNGMDFALVTNVANSLLAVVIIHNSVLYTFTVTVRWSLLVFNWISFVVSDFACADAFFIDITFKSYFHIFMNAKDLVLADQISSVKVNIALAVSSFGS